MGKGKKEITRFGQWIVTTAGIEWGGPECCYIITKNSLWETREYGDDHIWNWPVHLVEKTWLKEADLQQFNKALSFAQNCFKADRPLGLVGVSAEQTLQKQQQLLRQRAEGSGLPFP